MRKSKAFEEDLIIPKPTLEDIIKYNKDIVERTKPYEKIKSKYPELYDRLVGFTFPKNDGSEIYYLTVVDGEPLCKELIDLTKKDIARWLEDFPFINYRMYTKEDYANKGELAMVPYITQSELDKLNYKMEIKKMW